MTHDKPWWEGLEGEEEKETVGTRGLQTLQVRFLSLGVEPMGLSLLWWKEQGFGVSSSLMTHSKARN